MSSSLLASYSGTDSGPGDEDDSPGEVEGTSLPWKVRGALDSLAPLLLQPFD